MSRDDRQLCLDIPPRRRHYLEDPRIPAWRIEVLALVAELPDVEARQAACKAASIPCTRGVPFVDFVGMAGLDRLWLAAGGGDPSGELEARRLEAAERIEAVERVIRRRLGE